MVSGKYRYYLMVINKVGFLIFGGTKNLCEGQKDVIEFRCWQAWGGHEEFQENVATMYHSILFAYTGNVLVSFCYGLMSIYVKIPIF